MLVNKTNQLIEEMNEVKTLYMTKMIEELGDSMDDDTLVSNIKMFKLLNTSMELMKEQAEVIDGINKKLDKLLARKES